MFLALFCLEALDMQCRQPPAQPVSPTVSQRRGSREEGVWGSGIHCVTPCRGPLGGCHSWSVGQSYLVRRRLQHSTQVSPLPPSGLARNGSSKTGQSQRSAPARASRASL